MSGDDHHRELRGPRVTDEDPVRHRRRGPTTQWCRRTPGVPHTPEIRLDRYVDSLQRYPCQDRRGRRACGWSNRHWQPRQPWVYLCWHQEYCTTCGKILTHRLAPTECPTYTPRNV